MCLVACQAFVIPATTVVRAPSHDSAIIRSDRLGGNFAYSVQEGHAYAAVTPVVQHVSTPVAVSYEAPAVRVAAPVAYGYPYAYGAPLAAPAVALEAPKYEVKTVETPKFEFKTIETPAVHHIASPYAYGYAYGAPLAAHTVAVEAPKFEVKTVETPAVHHIAAPYAYGYGAPFAHYGSYAPYQIVEAAAPAEE